MHTVTPSPDDVLTATLAVERDRPRWRERSAWMPALRAARVPLVIAAVTLLVFAPALWNEFVDWDDQANFIDNHGYRGLGATQLRWMFTTFLMGQWIPLTWMTLGLDYVLWGMKPLGYHLTNLLVHAANAALFYFIARRLIRVAIEGLAERTLTVGAAAAALFFALHPLRVESVAWITERRDVVSAFFFLLSTLTYLTAVDGRARRARWLAASLGCFLAAVLSKSVVVTLPALLVLLDVYPLKRLVGWPRRWLAHPARSVLMEKIPYLILALGGALMAIWAQRANHFLTSLQTLPLGDRVFVAFYSLGFYLAKTILPTGLSPLHELPYRINPVEARFVASVIAGIGLSAMFVALRRRWPAGLAAWLAYAVTLAPMSGILHNGHQLAHDRYSYLTCLSWAVLFGGLLIAMIRAEATGVIRPSIARFAYVTAVVWVLGFGALTWHQTRIWRDNDSLWRYALEADPQCSICHANLAVSLSHQRILDLAIAHFERTLALRPDRVKTHGSLGVALLMSGRPAEAQPHFEQVVAKYPADDAARVNLAVSLLQLHRPSEARDQLREVLRRAPTDPLGNTNMALLLLDSGQPTKAIVYLRRAVEANPDLAPPRWGLVRTYLALGQTDRAQEQLEALKALDPKIAQQAEPLFITTW